MFSCSFVSKLRSTKIIFSFCCIYAFVKTVIDVNAVTTVFIVTTVPAVTKANINFSAVKCPLVIFISFKGYYQSKFVFESSNVCFSICYGYGEVNGNLPLHPARDVRITNVGNMGPDTGRSLIAG